MALTLKEQFQIKTVPAYEAADGSKFHDLPDAQDHTRRSMLEAAINAAVKANPQFARLDKPLLTEFLLMTGKHVGAVMAESLAPVERMSAGISTNRLTTGSFGEPIHPEGDPVKLAEARMMPYARKPITPEAQERLDSMERRAKDILGSASANSLKDAMEAVDEDMAAEVEKALRA